ncbi:MAG: heavy-metal-associated domain-containing protein [Burkholderiaceae bacterium]
MKTDQLSITGLHCNGCIESLTRALRTVRGVKDAKVSLASGTASIEFDEKLASTQELTAAVQRAGYGVAEPGEAQTSAAGRGCCGG